MQSCPNGNAVPGDNPGVIKGGLDGRLRGGIYDRLIASSVVVGLLFTMMTTIGITSAPAYAAKTIDGCTIVAHPTATQFTNCPGDNLSGVDLPGANLSFANLTGADLNGTDLSQAKLTDAKLTGADLLNANLSDGKLQQANLSNTTLAVGCFPPPVMCGSTNLDGAQLADANLAFATTSSCLVIAVPPNEVSFCGGVSMAGANLEGANFMGNNLAFANLSKAKLTGATLSGVIFGACEPSFPGDPLCGTVDLAGARLKQVNLSGMQMEGTQLSGANLAAANLSNSDLSPLVEPMAGSIPTNLSGANLQHADLQGANLDGANLIGARLAHVTWSNTTCPDGTNSDNDRGTCVNNLG
jgi:uncharacterized protein YjbI with pentapeptide repeats